MTMASGSSGYATATEAMHRAGQHVHQVNDRVQADLASLRNQLAPLAGAWRGEAATAFGALMARWDDGARTLNGALRGIGDAIQGSGRNYQQVEEQQSQSLSAIRGALG